MVDHLHLERFDLVGVEEGGCAAIFYAARFPGRVSHLPLLNCFARSEALDASQRRRAIVGLTDDWEMMTENVGALAFGFGWEGAKAYAEFIRKCITPETFRRLLLEQEWDLTPLLADISSPTLVVRHEGLSWPMEATTELATGIANARLHVAEGLYLDKVDQLWMTRSEFLELAAPGGSVSGALQAPSASTESVRTLPSATAIILFADIADSTALTERLGDAAFREKARDLDATLRNIIREAGGTPVEGRTLGDGVLAVFASARQAIEAAFACRLAGASAEMPLHLGLHAGDVIREEGNVYGGAVNVAARIASASNPGEVLVSQTVRDLARTSAGVTFEDRGQRRLRGVEGRQRLFAVRPREDN